MMFRNLMNGVSLASMMLRDAENDAGASDPKAALREKLAKGNLTTPAAETPAAEPEADADPDPADNDADHPDADPDADPVDPPVEETAEQKAEREAKEKIEAKAKRKDDRMQRRIDMAIAEKKAADAEIVRLKAQIEANPDQKLTAEEVESRAEAIAAKKVADREIEELNTKFQAACGKLMTEAIKVDKDFDAKIHNIARDFGLIPVFMINVLDELDNGGEVLAFIANDDEVAEHIYSLENKQTKMTKALVEISNKLAEAKKAPRRQISRVPDPITPVTGSRVASTAITEADTKNMDNYVAKRQKQMAEQRKLKGF